MEVLSGTKSVLFHTFLYQKSARKLWIIEIPYVILNILFLAPMIINTTLMIYRMHLELAKGGGIKEVSGSFYIAMGCASTIAIYSSFVMNSKLIISLVEQIENTVDIRHQQSDKSKAIYANCDNGNKSFVRKMKIFSIYVIISTVTVPILCPVGYAIFGFPQPHLWFFPFPIAVWWDTTHTLGYYVALLPQIGCTINYMTSVSIMITFFGGICSYVEACVDDLSTLIPQMNEIAAKYTTNGRNYERIGLQLRYTIFDMIKLHTDILRMVDLFRMILSGPIFFQLFVYCVFLALNLLQFDKSSGFSLAMALNVNALLTQILFNYVTCNYSTNVLGKLNDVSDIAFDAHWYTFPVTDQKLFPLVIHRTQKQIQLTGYKIITCSRETFLTLLKSAVSYFIVFRRFS